MKLVPLVPIDGLDKCFSQLFKPIAELPYIAAGVKALKPLQPLAGY